MEDLTPVKRMERATMTYFGAEKRSSMYLSLIALIGLVVGALLQFKGENPLQKGASYPIVAIGTIQLIVGTAVFLRTNRQLVRLLKKLRVTPRDMVTEELERMRIVMNNFDRYKTVEMLLFFLGLSFVVAGAFCGMGEFTLGTGVGLSIQAAITLVFDLFAAYRAGFYQYELEVFEQGVG